MLAKALNLIAKEAVEKVTETEITAKETADLGAIKPPGFGSLIRKRFSDTALSRSIDGLYSLESLQRNTGIIFFKTYGEAENPYLSLRYNEVAKECSEYLCDYGITPWAWKNAELAQRMDMVKTAVSIMADELRLPYEWAETLKPIAVRGKDYMAAATCKAKVLSNGGVDIIGVPALEINVDYINDDFFSAISTVYHEMIHMKQYASIDGLAPKSTTDSRLLDLIKDIRAGDGSYNSSFSRVKYLSSPFEAEAWAQESYFKQMLNAVIKERFA